jgi:hypothetical protein
MANQSTSRLTLYNSSSDGGDVNTERIWHCDLSVLGNGIADFMIDRRTADSSSFTYSTNAEMKNSIITITNPKSGGTTIVGLNGDGSKMVANAYSIDTFADGTGKRVYSADTSMVEISSRDGWENLAPNDTTIVFGEGIPLGVEYDINLEPRDLDAPTIGSEEGYYSSQPASDIVRAINSAVSTINSTIDSYLTDGRVKLSSVDGISDQSMRESLLAYIAGKSTLIDNGNGTKTITYKKQDGTSTKLSITFNNNGEFVGTSVA